jgi:hypothetical protein
MWVEAFVVTIFCEVFTNDEPCECGFSIWYFGDLSCCSIVIETDSVWYVRHQLQPEECPQFCRWCRQLIECGPSGSTIVSWAPLILVMSLRHSFLMYISLGAKPYGHNCWTLPALSMNFLRYSTDSMGLAVFSILSSGCSWSAVTCLWSSVLG